MKNINPNQRSVIVAAVVAGLLMIVSGGAYHVLSARLSTPANTTSLSPDALERLPLRIGDWTGYDVPLDEDIVAATDTDAHIHRRYLRDNSSENLSLYIAYGVNARDLMPHRPEVCYTGAGWTVIDSRSMELPASDGIKLPCNIFQFSRGSLNTKKIIVLDYYIVDGQYCHDVSLLRSKAWRGSGMVDSVAQVQIVASVAANQITDSVTKIVCDFAIESVPLISSLFEITKDQNSDKDCSHANRIFEETNND